ncbi:hypothetical protein FOZ61_003644 [Perkinsus olseni]|uniref:NET domain-containing protein n=1 Tax=Perkinsus olseni TaxID=32597 RepID=A0A7J6LMK9_PEROL|nr:hypothetical protein FOL46_006177 [Perkinsus olseni]KAF4660973.1 hypothetical protein FOZ61_003644 [Perkinsus olseni]
MLQFSSTPTAQQPSEVLHRGELLLRPDEADDLNTSIAESGMQFEEVGYPADPPSPPTRRTRAKAKAKSASRRRKAASSPSSSQAATSPGSPGPAQPPATLRNGAPKRRGRPSKAASPPPSSESEEGDQAIALPKLEGLAETRRSALLGVLEGIKKDGQKRQEKDRISYWYGTASFPEQIEGAKPRAYQLPTDLASIRKNVQEGKYETHLALEKDINKIVRHGLRNFPSDSGPFKAAERLNKLGADLVQKASYKINNEDYKENYVSTEVMAAIFSKGDGGQSETNTAKENHRSKSGKKKRGSKRAKGSKDSEQNLDSLNKQIAQLQEKLAMLADKGISLTQPPATSPGTPPEGGSPGRGSQAHLPLTIDEKNKLEDDMNQLTAEDLALVVEKKLKGRPGVVLDDATGQLCELDVDLMSPRDQRNLKRYVARLLNLHNQKVKENEERAREIVAHEKAVAQLQAERALKRKRRDEDDGSSSSGSSSDSSSGSSSSDSDSSDDEASDRDELARIYEKGAAAQ